jgi:hypothetical protein
MKIRKALKLTSAVVVFALACWGTSSAVEYLIVPLMYLAAAVGLVFCLSLIQQSIEAFLKYWKE